MRKYFVGLDDTYEYLRSRRSRQKGRADDRARTVVASQRETGQALVPRRSVDRLRPLERCSCLASCNVVGVTSGSGRMVLYGDPPEGMLDGCLENPEVFSLST